MALARTIMEPVEIHRMPPHSSEAEQGVLGSMIMSREAIAEAADRVSEDYFYVPAHTAIYNTLVDLWKKSTAIDLITFTQELRDRNLLESVGGASYVTHLFTFVPTAANLPYYLAIMRDKYVAREIIAKCTELVRAAYESQDEIQEVLDQTQGTLTEIIMQTEHPEQFRHVKEGVTEWMDRLEHAYHHRGQTAINGLATGLTDLDRMTSGLKDQQFIIVGARPSQGKSALAMNFASNMAVANKVPVGVFSMEMSFQEVVDRLGCSVSGVSLQRFRDGFLSKADFAKIPEHASKMLSAPLWIDESPALSISSFKARARLMKMRMGVKAIIVDYLQLMRSTSRRAQDARWLEITEISAALKSTAKELKLPIICCAQLNREPEGREFGKPKLSDLRESGSIEQDADVVVLLWRPERHLENYDQRNKLAKLLKLKDEAGKPLFSSERKKDQKDLFSLTREQTAERDRQINEYAELLLVKQRNGPVGDVRLRFTPDLTRFDNVTKKMWSNREDERQQKQ